jgi:hypothetical protein
MEKFAPALPAPTNFGKLASFILHGTLSQVNTKESKNGL